MILPLELWKIEGGPSARWTLKDFESEIAHPDSLTFLLKEQSGEIQGFVLYRVFPDGIEIMNLAVREKNKGHGKRLMEGLLEALRQDSRHEKPVELRLEVSSINLPALRLYQGSGFIEFARRSRYYKDSSDALLMKLLID